MPGARAVDVACALLLLVLLAVSMNSLGTFPDSFSDEGFYAQAGVALATTGTFTSFDLPDGPAFKAGDGIRPRVVAALFGLIGREFGYSLEAARAISFALVWAAVLLWLPITKSLGLPPFLGALLFASSERVFWASHVFRPEAALILVNTVLVLMIVAAGRAGTRKRYWFGRGVLNAPLVLAHGNGLVSAVVNTVDVLARRGRGAWRGWAARAALYGGGALLAVAVFYLVQVAPVGGWRVFAQQLQAAAQYHPENSPWNLVRSDLELRWGRELFVVGASVVAKGMRVLWYLVVFAAALHGIVRGRDLSRRLALAAIGTVIGYTLLVYDRADIHIAEMVPFFCASFLAWVGHAAHERSRERQVAAAATMVLLIAGLGLCLHHGIKYRPHAYRPAPEATAQAVRVFLASDAARALPAPRVVVGNDSLWFWLKDVVPVVPPRHAKEGPAPAAGVIVACRPGELPWLDRCALEYADRDHGFAAYRCPIAAPAR